MNPPHRVDNAEMQWPDEHEMVADVADDVSASKYDLLHRVVCMAYIMPK